MSSDVPSKFHTESPPAAWQVPATTRDPGGQGVHAPVDPSQTAGSIVASTEKSMAN
jgi:hypothetical protein